MIRSATIKDLEQLTILWLAFVLDQNPDYEPNANWYRRDMLGLFSRQGYLCSVIEIDGSIVGYTDTVVSPDAAMGRLVAWSRGSYIRPEYRHVHTRALYEHMYASARELGCHVAQFSCNDSLLPLWQRQGFIKTDNLMTGVI